MADNNIHMRLPDGRQIDLDGDNFTWPDKDDTVSYHRAGENLAPAYRVASTHITYELNDEDEVIKSDVFMNMEEVGE